MSTPPATRADEAAASPICQFEFQSSSLMTSPLLRVISPRRTTTLIVSPMNLTEPSPITTFAPPR